jgi:hypothetical protein
VEFDTTLSHEQFRSWRTAARNLVDHKRRECRWWREVAMQVWLGADGRLRGVVSLDAITCEEFEEAFRRWPITLANIEADELAGAIYAAVEPTVTVHSGGQSGQAVRFTLKPQKVASPLKGAGYRASQASHPEHAIEPMPCLFA